MTGAETRKPLLVGESNPYGGGDEFALYPAPDGCSGHRLCCLILGMRRSAYLDSFARCNLVQGKWSIRAARERARRLWSEPSPRFILLGSKVCAAFETPFVAFEAIDGGTILKLPHPSGLCRLWNEPRAFVRAREAVAAFIPELSHLIGQQQ